MKILEVRNLVFSDVKVIRYERFKDDRGYFTETFRESDFKTVISNFSIKQVNESYSSVKGVLRGLHLQWSPYMGKLIRTVKGHMVDLFLDIRKNSPTYGKVAAYDMPERPK
ncbi:dTDP-4-dehydrorhamnose 3,5-epimerase family protein, partial [Candidatus Roizmanbacteria bacterium]|nr:dTDP-4-dehydrorhamnose 3,5-epimerase family protein [Candidatus Roizmanbacteria bacterium]